MWYSRIVHLSNVFCCTLSVLKLAINLDKQINIHKQSILLGKFRHIQEPNNNLSIHQQMRRGTAIKYCYSSDLKRVFLCAVAPVKLLGASPY